MKTSTVKRTKLTTTRTRSLTRNYISGVDVMNATEEYSGFNIWKGGGLLPSRHVSTCLTSSKKCLLVKDTCVTLHCPMNDKLSREGTHKFSLQTFKIWCLRFSSTCKNRRQFLRDWKQISPSLFYLIWSSCLAN